MRSPKRRLPCFVCAVVLAALAAAAPGVAQKSHDALARARALAKFEGQRVLLLLRGEGSPLGKALEAALGNYRDFGKLLKYEYQLAAQPANSLAARHLRAKLDLPKKLHLPTLVKLDATTLAVLGTLQADAMRGEQGIDRKRLGAFLERDKAPAPKARAVLDRALALAQKTKRQVFVYLSAPW